MSHDNLIKHNGVGILEIVDFVTSNYRPYRGKEREIEKVIKKLIEYDMGDYGVDDNGLVYVVRWNIDKDKLSATVEDFIVRKDRRNDLSLIKYIIGRNWAKYPWVTEINFKRLEKYPYRKSRSYKLLRFFNKENNNGRRRNKNSSTTATSTANSGTIG